MRASSSGQRRSLSEHPTAVSKRRCGGMSQQAAAVHRSGVSAQLRLASCLPPFEMGTRGREEEGGSREDGIRFVRWEVVRPIGTRVIGRRRFTRAYYQPVETKRFPLYHGMEGVFLFSILYIYDMVKRTVVSSIYQGSNSDAHIYSRIYFRISGDAHSMGGDVSVDDEMPTVT